MFYTKSSKLENTNWTCKKSQNNIFVTCLGSRTIFGYEEKKVDPSKFGCF